MECFCDVYFFLFQAVIRLATKTGVRCLTAPVIDEKFRSEKLELEKEKQRNKEINSLSSTLNNHHHIPLTHTQTHVSTILFLTQCKQYQIS